MTFDNVAHPRDTDGKFAEKLGAAPEVGLQGPSSVEDVASVIRAVHPQATKIVYRDPATSGDARFVQVFDGNNERIDYGINKFRGLDDALDRLPNPSWGARDFEVVQESMMTRKVEEMNDFLGGNVNSALITRSEVDRLRYAVNHAEYKLAESELKAILAKEAPGSFGIAVAQDDEGNAYPVGIETAEAIPNIGRNWGVIDYENIPDGVRDWFVTDGYRLGRDDYLTDYADNLSNSYGDFDDDDIIWDGRPVYRVAVS